MNHITRSLPILACLFASVVLAGELDSPAPVDDPDSAMHSIGNLCERLQSGAPGVKRSTPFSEPVTGPGATNCTLDEAMSAAPALDNTDGATATKVLNDNTYWSLRDGEWGLRTGTMPNNAGESASLGQSASAGVNKFTPVEGFYDGVNDTVTATDAEISALEPNLLETNIACGTTIFGVTGIGVGGFSTTNCGACDVMCGFGESCNGSGACACGSTTGGIGSGAACGAETCCSENCTDLTGSLNNCGACGISCGTSETCGGSRCRCGADAGAPGGGRVCTGTANDTCCPVVGCTDLTTSLSNCGACGMSCGQNEVCTAGVCQ